MLSNLYNAGGVSTAFRNLPDIKKVPGFNIHMYKCMIRYTNCFSLFPSFEGKPPGKPVLMSFSFTDGNRGYEYSVPFQCKAGLKKTTCNDSS